MKGPEITPISLPPELDRRFKIIAFDWDGTAVPNRHADASEVTRAIDTLLALGVFVVAATGTNIDNMYNQSLKFIPSDHKERLFACTNRGSEIFSFDLKTGEPSLLQRRVATPEEEQKLSQIAEEVKDQIETATSLKIDIVYDRLNRRKIDCNTAPQWTDPPKARIAELEKATQELLKGAGFPDGMGTLFEMTQSISEKIQLLDSRMTTDMKYLEIGLTDKGDSIRWLMNELAKPNNISAKEIMIGGDEFGPLGGASGSDYKMVVPEAGGAAYVSVGLEPHGVTPPVIYLGGGPDSFVELLNDQIRRHSGN